MSPNLEAVGAPPTQLWTVNVLHFYFCLFLHVNLGLSQFSFFSNNSGLNPFFLFWVGVTLDFGTLLPPSNFKVVPESLTEKLLTRGIRLNVIADWLICAKSYIFSQMNYVT